MRPVLVVLYPERLCDLHVAALAQDRQILIGILDEWEGPVGSLHAPGNDAVALFPDMRDALYGALLRPADGDVVMVFRDPDMRNAARSAVELLIEGLKLDPARDAIVFAIDRGIDSLTHDDMIVAQIEQCFAQLGFETSLHPQLRSRAVMAQATTSFSP